MDLLPIFSTEREHYMIDIETGGVPKDGNNKILIAAIAVVPFQMHSDKKVTVGASLLYKPHLGQQLLRGFEVSRDTMGWWNKQPTKESVWESGYYTPCHDVITNLRQLQGGLFYAKGGNFDFPILEAFCDEFGGRGRYPWKYNEVYCTRLLSRIVAKDDNPNPPSHHPVDDCYDQINELYHNLVKLGLINLKE